LPKRSRSGKTATASPAYQQSGSACTAILTFPASACFGLQLSDLEAAAGRGVLRVYVQDNGNTWEFEFEDGDQRICGRKVIPRAPQWAEHTAGNA
jgi:hypothetical protein